MSSWRLWCHEWVDAIITGLSSDKRSIQAFALVCTCSLATPSSLVRWLKRCQHHATGLLSLYSCETLRASWGWNQDGHTWPTVSGDWGEEKKIHFQVPGFVFLCLWLRSLFSCWFIGWGAVMVSSSGLSMWSPSLLYLQVREHWVLFVLWIPDSHLAIKGLMRRVQAHLMS